MDAWTFLLATLSLLATPGPTNTLLATSGASAGLRRSLPLLAAELAGYLAAIAVLRTVVGPMIAAVPAFGVALRVAVVIYLLHLAATLWRHGASRLATDRPITFGRVLVTTLLNPKAIIFAFTLLPESEGATLWSRIAVLALAIFVVGSGWIFAGAALRRGFVGSVPAHVGYRASAIALTLLAGGIGAHAVSVAGG